MTLLGRQFGFPPFSSIPSGVPPPSSFFGFPPAPTVTTTLTIVPAIQETTIITLVTSTGTSVTTITTFSTNTNVVSTTTQTSFSITALPNPAATAGLAQASSLLASNASLTRTNITVSLVLGILTFLLLVLIAIIFFLYLRRRRKPRKGTDDESPPFTSLAPRPAPFPIITPDRPLRQSMQETSLSMGSRGGTADFYNRAVREAQARTSDALNSHPLTRPSRSFSAPINAPALERTTRIPLFDTGVPSINIMPNTPASSRRARTVEGRDERSPSPITTPPNVSQPPLRRNQPNLQRVPMYHAALQEQAQ